MTPEVHHQLVRLADHTPSIYQDAWRGFLARGAAAAPDLVEGLDDPKLGAVCHWRILLVLRELRVPATLPAILRAYRTAAANGDAIVLPGALDALAVFDDEEAWAALTSALDLRDAIAVGHAAVLLAQKGGRRAEEAIARLLARPEPAMRQAGVAALSRIDTESARATLARHRASEKDPDVLKLFGRTP
jgi:HEAT repeat protein